MVQKPWPLPPQTSASSALLFDEGVLVGYFAIQSETERMKHNQFAILGFVLLLPATGLVTLGLLGQDVPRLLDSPFVVLPSLLGALLLNLLPIVRFVPERVEGGVIAALSFRIAVKPLNLIVVGLSGLLLAVICGYAFVENFRPR